MALKRNRKKHDWEVFMKVSQLIGKRFKEKPSECTTEGHGLLVRGGYIKQVSSGIYSGYHPMKRISRKIEQILREEMDGVSGQEIDLPIVLPATLWRESGRYDKVDRELLRFKDRNSTDMVLAMTHEEAILDLVRESVETTDELPFMIYQLQTKYRDEARPRAGLIRVREFLMKDAYSFHETEADLKKYYEEVKQAYVSIFKRAGLKDVVIVESGSGMMGGDVSHEFMYITEMGEDKLALCSHCGYGMNLEDADLESNICPKCQSKSLNQVRGIEVGNIFQLGDTYTRSMNMTVKNQNGENIYPVMGCYGIGVGRLIGTLAEACRDEKGIIWPKSVSPWQVHLCSLQSKDERVKEVSEHIYNKCRESGIDILYDDRDVRAGAMFADADLLGVPLRIVVSEKTLKVESAEVVLRGEDFKENIALDSIFDTIKAMI